MSTEAIKIFVFRTLENITSCSCAPVEIINKHAKVTVRHLEVAPKAFTCDQRSLKLTLKCVSNATYALRRFRPARGDVPLPSDVTGQFRWPREPEAGGTPVARGVSARWSGRSYRPPRADRDLCRGATSQSAALACTAAVSGPSRDRGATPSAPDAAVVRRQRAQMASRTNWQAELV